MYMAPNMGAVIYIQHNGIKDVRSVVFKILNEQLQSLKKVQHKTSFAVLNYKARTVFCTPTGPHIYLRVLKSVQFTVPAAISLYARGKVCKLTATTADILRKFLLIMSLSPIESRYFSPSTI
jgi:hypothetical protein